MLFQAHCWRCEHSFTHATSRHSALAVLKAGHLKGLKSLEGPLTSLVSVRNVSGDIVRATQALRTAERLARVEVKLPVAGCLVVLSPGQKAAWWVWCNVSSEDPKRYL